jgi:hypothetical protein
MTCSQCQTEIVELPSYEVRYNSTAWNFCSRVCLVEYIAPELNKAVVPRQWIPTEEEEERMSQ